MKENNPSTYYNMAALKDPPDNVTPDKSKEKIVLVDNEGKEKEEVRLAHILAASFLETD